MLLQNLVNGAIKRNLPDHLKPIYITQYELLFSDGKNVREFALISHRAGLCWPIQLSDLGCEFIDADARGWVGFRFKSTKRPEFIADFLKEWQATCRKHGHYHQHEMKFKILSELSR